MNCSKEDIVVELQRVYKLLGKPFSRREFAAHSKFAKSTIENRFGSWSAAIKAAGLCDRFEKYRSVQEEMAGFEPEKIVEDEWKKRKTELRDNAEQRKVKWLRDQSAKKDILMEMLADTLTRAEPPVIDVHPIRVEVRKSKSRHCTLWLEFSDNQLGTCFSLEDMGGINRHDWVVWQEKLNSWKKQVIDLISEYKSYYTIDHVIISALGDHVEGADIFKGQTWQVDRHVVDQAIFGANDTAASFIEIFLTHPDVDFQVMQVFGNHGRLGRKGEFPFSCSMDRVFLHMLHLQIGSAGVKNCAWHNNDCWYWFTEIYGWNHLLLHGDQGMGGLWSGRPTINSLEKGLSRWNQILQNNIHFIHIGHFHNSSTWSFNSSQMLINGSFVGTSPFSATQMLASSPAEQIYHVLTPECGLVSSGHIYLDQAHANRIKPKQLQSELNRKLI